MVKLTVRLPEELHKAIEALSEKEKRSLNSEIIFILEGYSKQKQENEQKTQR